MTTPRPPDTSSLATALAGQFAIERELGRGGMGIVLLARDLKLDRPVALKVLPPELAAKPDMRERFLREARTAARLSHPNIVPIYRADDVQGVAFFAMAYVDGQTLAERLRDRARLPAQEAVRLLREVAWALAYAHARGVVHRDIKPENIMLERVGGRALVTDFGIAHMAEASRLTQDGQVLGTVHYMSPEQALGAEVDGRSDLYSLGVVAYQLLTGKLPFQEQSAAAVLVAHATREPQSILDVAPELASEIPPALATVVARCLAKRPEDRPPTGEALSDALGAAIAMVAGEDTLPPGLPQVVDPAEAEAIWRRAAQLQADALRRLEERRDLLPLVTSTVTPATATSNASLTSGHRLRDVVDAAAEAGISRQYVAMALAELPQNAEQALERVPKMGVSERTATRFLGTDERSLGVSVVVEADAGRVLRAVGTVLQQQPYELRLHETVGPHPLDGGILVFNLPGKAMIIAETDGTKAGFWANTRQALEASQVQVMLRALPGESPRTELSMLCDLRPGVRRNVRASQAISGLAAVVGGGVGTIVAGGAVAASAGTLGLALVAAPALLAGGAVAAGSVAWYRWLYRNAAAKATEEMRLALEAVASTIRTEQLFGSLPERPRSAGELSPDEVAAAFGYPPTS